MFEFYRNQTLLHNITVKGNVNWKTTWRIPGSNTIFMTEYQYFNNGVHSCQRQIFLGRIIFNNSSVVSRTKGFSSLWSCALILHRYSSTNGARTRYYSLSIVMKKWQTRMSMTQRRVLERTICNAMKYESIVVLL